MALPDHPYASAAEEWRAAGWSPLPLPPRRKKSPPDGYTGAEGRDVDPQQVAAWIDQQPDGNIALRLPPDVVGIDVDAYKPAGAESWATLTLKCGPLPDSWTLTSRTDGTSGIYLYRIPHGLKLRGVAAPGVETIQHHHRYAVTWPSVHPDTGAMYRLTGPDGDDNCPIPHPDELPALPETWIDELKVRPRDPATPVERHHAGEWSHAVQAAFADGMAGMTKGSRHDTARDTAAALARLERQDHPGAADALDALGRHLTGAITDRCTPDEAQREWIDLLVGARALVQSTPSYRPVWDDLGPTRLIEPGSLIAANGAEPVEPDDLTRFLDPDVDEFLAGEEPPYDWVIPDVAESGDRIILTGEEGKGKSTLLRQIAVQVASGIHPFTGELIEPAAVHVIDCENSRRQTRRKLRPLRELCAGLDPERLRINVVGHALDLARPATYQDIALRVRAHQPRLIIIGPLYKMTDGDPTKEEPARALADALDALRAICGSALLIEAHTPYADGSKSKRPNRPYGASLWSRWPEFGVFLAADGSLEHWRGPRDERTWPRRLERSSPWPWAIGEVGEEPEQWDGPTHCMEALETWFRQRPGEEVAKSTIPVKLRALDLAYRDRTIYHALERLTASGVLSHRKGPRSSDLYTYGEPVDNRAF